MELKAKLVKLLPEQRGNGRNGEWIKREFVCSYGDEFPKEICFALWGDRVQLLNGILPGNEVIVKFNVESREHEGRYFSECKAWLVALASGVQPAQQAAQPAAQVFDKPQAEQAAPDAPVEDDLPF